MRTALQRRIDDHNDAMTEDELAALFLDVLRAEFSVDAYHAHDNDATVAR
jgi:hypothetical protein